jgi:hypothetical protein
VISSSQNLNYESIFSRKFRCQAVGQGFNFPLTHVTCDNLEIAIIFFIKRQMFIKGVLKVNVHTATLLTDPQIVGKADLYLKLWTKDDKFQTRTHSDCGKYASWNQSFCFNLRGANATSMVHFIVMNKNVVADDKIGK